MSAEKRETYSYIIGGLFDSIVYLDNQEKIIVFIYFLSEWIKFNMRGLK